MNMIVYIITIVASIALLVPACASKCDFLNILSGIGCSGIAAAIMAIFLDMAAQKRENEKRAKARASYFIGLNNELRMMIERILWFDERMNDDFDWDKDPSIYTSFPYELSVFQRYPHGEVIPFEKAMERLDTLSKKYSLEQQEKMAEEQKHKIQKMFSILSASAMYLMAELNVIERNKIELDSNGYLSLKEIFDITHQVPLAIALMGKPEKNYGVAIKMFASAYKTIRCAGNFNEEINVGLNSSLKISDI